jgi:hypothetical protein
MEDIIGFDDQMSGNEIGFFSTLRKKLQPRLPKVNIQRNSQSLFKKIATQSRQPQPLTLAQKNAIAKLRAKAASSKRKGIFRFF